MTPEQFDRLPKHAQDFIRCLQGEVNNLTKEVAAFRHPGDSKIVWSDFGADVCAGIPASSTVTFRIGEFLSVDVAIVGDELEIRGNRGLVITPKVSNEIHVSVK